MCWFLVFVGVDGIVVFGLLLLELEYFVIVGNKVINVDIVRVNFCILCCIVIFFIVDYSMYCSCRFVG